MLNPNNLKRLAVAILTLVTAGCATLTEDAMTPIALSFSDGSEGKCQLTNKRAAYSTEIPTTISVRKSDDALKYQCETKDGKEAVGTIASTMGGKIIASAIFLDFGITDAITDKHREYPASFVIPVAQKLSNSGSSSDSSADTNFINQPGKSNDVSAQLKTLSDLRDQGIITDAEFDAAKRKLLERN